jgi:hypothetical protein
MIIIYTEEKQRAGAGSRERNEGGERAETGRKKTETGSRNREQEQSRE